MRANLKYFLARLALVAAATLGLSTASFAHDLPEGRALATTAKAPAAISHAPKNYLLAVARPDAGNAPRPDVSPSQPAELIAIALPDAGTAPRPIATEPQLPKLATASVRASEVYMPYDFQLSDWRFGQFPYHGKTASAPTPVALPELRQATEAACTLAQASPAAASQLAVKYGPPSPQSAALGELLQQLDQWQCAAYSLMTDEAALSRSAKRTSQVLGQWATNYRPGYWAADTSAATPAIASVNQPLPTVGPQLVIYESAAGGHIVLTVEQARDWQFSTVTNHSRINDALGAAFEPIRSSALATASRQLEFAGRGLLSLSRSLSSIADVDQAEAKVASLPGRND